MGTAAMVAQGAGAHGCGGSSGGHSWWLGGGGEEKMK